MSEISIDDFKKIELRTAKVLDVQEIPGADKLWKLDIDLGSEKRQIVAGIKMSYTRENLIGRSIIVLANLAPAVIRGTESRGMLLAAKNSPDLSILTLERDLPPGSIVG